MVRVSFLNDGHLAHHEGVLDLSFVQFQLFVCHEKLVAVFNVNKLGVLRLVHTSTIGTVMSIDFPNVSFVHSKEKADF